MSAAPEQAVPEGGCQQVSVVDDDASVRRALSNLLQSAGIQVDTFDSAHAFLASPGAASTHCLVLDLEMPGMSGEDLLAALAASRRNVTVVVLTATRKEAAAQLLARGVFAFLTKPFRADQVLAAVKVALSAPPTLWTDE
jgi:FixJ family two-component response regulator